LHKSCCSSPVQETGFYNFGSTDDSL
jgi:hypothetical protein